MDHQTLIKESHIAAQPSSALQPLRPAVLLPVESLVEIFLLSLPPVDLAQAPQKTALSLVCRLWNAIVGSTPILWTRVTTADSISHVRKSLSKSGDHRLDVHGECSICNVPPKYVCDGVCCEFMREVGSCTARWGRVLLKVCHQGAECIRPDAMFPSLSVLKVLWRDCSPGFGHEVAMFSQARSPNLRELSLQSTRIRSWNQISLPQSLSRLDIGFAFKNDPSLAGWLWILSGCPNLTVLRVQSIGIYSSIPYDIEPIPADPFVIVEYPGLESLDLPALQNLGFPTLENLELPALQNLELPALQNLELLSIHARLARCFLVQLRFPDECAVTVRCSIKGPSPSTSFLSPALSRHHPDFQRAEKTDRATIAVTELGGRFRLIAVRQRWCVDIDLTGADGVRDALEWFGISTENGSNPWSHSETLQAGPSNHTTLMLDKHASRLIPKPGGGYTSSLDFDLLNAISAHQFMILEIKTMGLSASEHVSLFQYISGYRDPNNPTTRCLLRFESHYIDTPDTRLWPFANLERLVLQGMNAHAMRALLEAIKTRSVDDGVTQGMLLRLKQIEFVDADAPTREGEHHALGDLHEEERLVLDILDILDEDAELIWKGKHFPKALNHK
ncbi:hypothetical protein FS837_009133 [Tulasnella sp. UAMH 9824]|nr:hypothetical protein FS837_009133 [Tulasnella sp. UAMH 9824]